ncbi:hypothetical protein BHF68_13230 [Desulfuribacillus alkaliarsenatis]|uniref:Flagellar biosynthesis protein FlaG n=1 Tax=Desulfuribacillus alkaliarsenatis TaxID=766136 RepID=A0A1E5G462_9FIRM|nr:hypothetical protein BHF68_13230 [Desulfuribacillus alkaliarsenatis]
MGNSDRVQPKQSNNQVLNQAVNQQASNQAHNQNQRQQSRTQANIESQRANQSQRQTVSEDDLLKAIERANSSIDKNNARFEYSIHEDTKRIMVKVVDTVNDEVIKEIPAEEVLDLVAKIWEMSGILLDEKR